MFSIFLSDSLSLPLSLSLSLVDSCSFLMLIPEKSGVSQGNFFAVSILS